MTAPSQKSKEPMRKHWLIPSSGHYSLYLRKTQVTTALAGVALSLMSVVIFALVAGSDTLTAFMGPALWTVVLFGVAINGIAIRYFLSPRFSREAMLVKARKYEVMQGREEKFMCLVLKLLRFVVVGTMALAAITIPVFLGFVFRLALIFGFPVVLGTLAVLVLLIVLFHYPHGPGWDFLRRQFNTDAIYRQAAH